MISRFSLGLLISLPLALGGTNLDCGGSDTPTPTPIPTPGGACMVTGCSGQVCASEPVATTCEWTCSYGCYQYASCETQSTGACGWTSTPEFDACIQKCGMN